MPGLPARPSAWPAPSSATPDPDPSASGARGTPHQSLKRSRMKRFSEGTHSHSVMDACTMRTQPRR